MRRTLAVLAAAATAATVAGFTPNGQARAVTVPHSAAVTGPITASPAPYVRIGTGISPTKHGGCYPADLCRPKIRPKR